MLINILHIFTIYNKYKRSAFLNTIINLYKCLYVYIYNIYKFIYCQIFLVCCCLLSVSIFWRWFSLVKKYFLALGRPCLVDTHLAG